MKRKLTMMLLCMMVAVTALAQSAINGTVVSAQDGEPIIGAAVKVKGAKQGVVTDLGGGILHQCTGRLYSRILLCRHEDQGGRCQERYESATAE